MTTASQVSQVSSSDQPFSSGVLPAPTQYFPLQLSDSLESERCIYSNNKSFHRLMGKKDVQRKRKWKILLVSHSDVTVGYSFHFRLFKSKSSTYHKLYRVKVGALI